jgi:hypothetical protein
MAIARAALPKRVVQSDFAGGGLTATVVHSIQTSFLNERIVDSTEAPAQSGRAFNSAS